MIPEKTSILETVRAAAHELGSESRYDSLIEMIGDARFVLLGEASHGTHEFYAARAEITRRLILEKGFTVVAWEADWPDAARVNTFVQNSSSDPDAATALSGFERFPSWMWRNLDVIDFVAWLRQYNDQTAEPGKKAGIYGLDLYSLHRSMHQVIQYLEKVDHEAAAKARKRYACFDDFGEDPQTYGLIASRDRSSSCEDAVVEQLREMQRRGGSFLGGSPGGLEQFFAEQNARVAVGAERYYRAMYYGRPNTWNLRDTHMVDTLDALMIHLETPRSAPKAVVWAHNSHLGDARATEMSLRGEHNVGQLLRERHPDECVLVGFSTHTGTVTAASDWDQPAERKWVRPALKHSWEELFHSIGVPNFLLTIGGHRELSRKLETSKIQRAIGVIYRPETERYSHYFSTRLSQQFDALIHFDETTAVEPVERTPHWEAGELPETYPSTF